MKKTIIVISNPFGYGPTGKAVEIIEAFRRHIKRDRLIYIGSGLCNEIIDRSGIDAVTIDERDENTLVSFMEKVEQPYIVSSQNRFAIRAAKRVGAKSAFLDGLAWFWREIPPDHLIADEIFWVNFPGMSEKAFVTGRSVHLIPALVSEPHIRHKPRNRLLIHIGGAWNPLTRNLPLSYLDMFSRLLTDAEFDADEVIVAGGRDAITYLREKGMKRQVILETFSHAQFIELVRSAYHFVTTAGQSATLEAFANGTPVSFLLPMNLSQYALTEMLAVNDVRPPQLQWQSYGAVEEDFTHLSEQNAIEKFSEYAENINCSKEKSARLLKNFNTVIKSPPNSTSQKSFIRRIGFGGADALVAFLCERWQLG